VPAIQGIAQDTKLLPDHGSDVGSCSEYRVAPPCRPFARPQGIPVWTFARPRTFRTYLLGRKPGGLV